MDDSSGDEGCCEIAYQVDGSKPYKANLLITNKAGQLVAAVHQYLVAKVLRHPINGKEIKEDLVGHGLFLHRVETYLLHILW